MQVKDALDKGAHLLLKGGCTDGPGSFYEPVVLGNVNHEMLLMKDESFGPIVGLQSVVSDDEALALMQDTPYGLTASVFTENADRAEQL